jgi:hypothetical protein
MNRTGAALLLVLLCLPGRAWAQDGGQPQSCGDDPSTAGPLRETRREFDGKIQNVTVENESYDRSQDCAPELFDQNCGVASPYDDCPASCVKPCAQCKERCVPGCERCQETCPASDNACRQRCLLSAAVCRRACARGADPCRVHCRSRREEFWNEYGLKCKKSCDAFTHCLWQDGPKHSREREASCRKSIAISDFCWKYCDTE